MRISDWSSDVCSSDLGTRVVGFDVADGDVGSLGAQWRWAPQWAGAASFLGTHGRILPDDFGEPVFEPGDTQALYAATAWHGAPHRAQFNPPARHGDFAQATAGWVALAATPSPYHTPTRHPHP